MRKKSRILRKRSRKRNRDYFVGQSQDANLSIWATFELLSLGKFGHFISCLNQNCRSDISKILVYDILMIQMP